MQVLSPARTTLENNGKIRLWPDRENAFVGASGGADATGVERSPVRQRRKQSAARPPYVKDEYDFCSLATRKSFVTAAAKIGSLAVIPRADAQTQCFD